MLTPVRTFFLFAAVTLAFGIYTSNAWEDYYITYRASKNLATGHGLVFTEGERVHTFTSPLGVLLPALCSYLAGPEHDDVALWLFRIISAVFLGGAGALLCLVLQTQGLSPALLWGVLALIAFDVKIVTYSSNGMETAILVFFICLELYALVVNSKNTVWLLGLAWGGAMWTRPDAFIYAGGLAVGILSFKAGIASTQGRGWLVKQFFMAGCLAVVLYLPWFVWAWSYYGSPIPNTIVAKGLREHIHPGASVWGGIEDILLLPWTFTQLIPIYALPYGRIYGSVDPLATWANALALFAGLPLVLPGMARLTRAVAVSYFVSAFYLFHLVLYAYPWYLPMCALPGYLAMGLCWNDICKKVHWPVWKQVSLPFLLVFGQVVLLASFAHETRIKQRVIEIGNRKAVGLWLRQNAASPHDTVFVECLGYIGFYSQLKMYDFPGMSSPEVIASRRKLGSDDWAPLIEDLQPVWLVLRPGEVEMLNQQKPAVLSREYYPVKVFDATEELKASHAFSRQLGGADNIFTVYHRTLPNSGGL